LGSGGAPTSATIEEGPAGAHPATRTRRECVVSPAVHTNRTSEAGSVIQGGKCGGVFIWHVPAPVGVLCVARSRAVCGQVVGRWG